MGRRLSLYLRVFLCVLTIVVLSLVTIGYKETCSNLAHAQNLSQGQYVTDDNPGILKAKEVQGRYSERLMSIPGVVGHGIGLSSEGKPEIRIFVMRHGIPDIPAVLEGIPSKAVITGMVVAHEDPTKWFERPVPIGVSTGHPQITAGTIGCRVVDLTVMYMLSAITMFMPIKMMPNRVTAALQPGAYDGGKDPVDCIGYLDDWEPIDFSGLDNYMDAAIAYSSKGKLGYATLVGGYGAPDSNPTSAVPDMPVQKYGRTTGLTEGKIEETNVTINVCYEARGPFLCTKSAKFVDQIGISPGTFSAGGDSGSLIVTQEGNNPVGLLFAGSATRTIANPIELVLTRFGVTVDGGSGGVTPEPFTDIAVTGLTSPSSVTQGESASITATVKNVGNQDVTDDIQLTLTISNDSGYSMIDGSKDIEGGLNAGGSTIITYTWNTSDPYASPGDYTIQVAHSYGDHYPANDSLETSINVKDASVEEPSDLNITGIDPNSMQVGTSLPVIITGSGFQSELKVAFENGAGPAPTASITAVSGTEIKATVTARSGGPKTNRVWDVRVTNPDGQSVVLARGFTVKP
jgi:hypothetical protein